MPNNETTGAETNRLNFGEKVAEDTKPVDGSHADIVNEIADNLEKQASDTEANTEIVAKEAPAAVADIVAASVASEETTKAIEAPVNADGKTLEELRAEQDAINQRINEQATIERAAVIDQIKSVVATYKIPVEELVEALGGLKSKRAGSKAKPKYRNPETSATWSGRGKSPLWIKDKNKEDFLIVDAE